MSPVVFIPDQSLQSMLAREGYVFVQAGAMRRALEAAGPLDDWNAFAASWGDLELDTHMADGGRLVDQNRMTDRQWDPDDRPLEMLVGPALERIVPQRADQRQDAQRPQPRRRRGRSVRFWGIWRGCRIAAGLG